MTRLRLVLVAAAVLVLLAAAFLVVEVTSCGSAQTYVFGTGCYPGPASN